MGTFDNQAGAPLRGVGFNTDPQTGDWDQLAYEGHTLIERVRGENTDTDDAFAVYVQGVNATTKVFNVLKTGAIWTGSNNTAVLSATSGITLAAAAAVGSGAFALRYDATIKAFQAVNPQPVGSVATYGSSSLASRDDHAHLGVTSIAASGNAALSGAFRLYAGAGVGLTQIADGVQIMASTATPAGASAGLPALILGTTNVAGGTNFIGVSSTITLYDGTGPGSETIGGSAVQGVGSFAARSNHGHAIANTNVTLLGGSWGSGPTLTNPQVAATGWASANHAHISGTTGGNVTSGYSVEILGWSGDKTHSTTVTRNQQSTQLGGGMAYLAATPQNGTRTWDRYFYGGTYTCVTVYRTDTDAGVWLIQIDGVTVVTFDAYAGSAANNNVNETASIAITAGVHTITVTSATKNASSSSYGTYLQLLSFERISA